MQFGQVIDLLETPQSQPKIFELPLEILFEDNFMAAIHKPAGFSVSGNAYKTIYNALPFNLKKSTESDALAGLSGQIQDWPEALQKNVVAAI